MTLEFEEIDEVVNCSCQENEEDGFMIQVLSLLYACVHIYYDIIFK